MKGLFVTAMLLFALNLRSQTIFYQYESQGLDRSYFITSVITSTKLNQKKIYYAVQELSDGKLVSENFYEPTKIIKGEFNTFQFECKDLRDDLFLRAIFDGNQLIKYVQVERLNDTIPMDVGGPIGGAIILEKSIPVFYAKAQKQKYIDWNIEIKKLIAEAGESSLPFFQSPDGFDGMPTASSTLKAQGKYTYDAGNLTDDSPLTAWVEGKEDYGIGEGVEMIKNYVGGIAIYNGLQASQLSFTNNSRAKTIMMFINDKKVCKLELEDKMGAQKFESKEFISIQDQFIVEDGVDPKKIKIKFVILDVYKGLKFKDTCISEITD